MCYSSCFIIVFFMLVGNGVTGDRMVRYIFNNGIPPSPNNKCTADDDRLIDQLFNITTYLRTRRQLTDSMVTNETVNLSDYESLYHHRELLPRKCKDQCDGYVPGTCRASGCHQWRRREQELLPSNPALKDQNHREEWTPCNAQITEINDALELLVTTGRLTQPCQNFVEKSKRKTECYDDVIYGEILSFTFYNMNLYNTRWWTPVVSVIGQNIENGYTICSTTTFNAEVVLNPCVNDVKFTMTGPNNYFYTRTDVAHPMLLFDTTENAATFGGRKLAPGKYYLSTIPDGFAFKEKKLEFNVKHCW